jgi:hypothetical protein
MISPGGMNHDAELARDMARFSRDPLSWVRYSFPWGEPGALESETGPDAWQAEALTDMARGLDTADTTVRIAVASGHGIGKTTLVAWLILWSLSTFPGTMGVVTANTATQLKTKTWAELSRWYQRFIARHWFDMEATSIHAVSPRHKNTWRFDAIPWSKENSEAFAGLHNQGRRTVIIFDEASAIDNVIWEVAEGAMMDKDTEKLWFAFGNPTRNTGKFADCFGRNKHVWLHRNIDARATAHTDKDALQALIDNYGIESDFVKVRVLGQFPDASSAQLIPGSLCDRGIERGRGILPGEYEFAPRILGADIARHGDDESCIAFRQGLLARILWRGHDLDLMTVASMIAFCEDRYHADAVFIDAGGIGGGVVDKLRELNRSPVEINFANKPTDARFANKRAEMWWNMREWLTRGGSLPERDIDGKQIADDIRGDLTAPEYFFTPSGKIMLERKEEMKKRGIESPDMGDALALTFAMPVAPKHTKEVTVYPWNAAKRKPYDPLARMNGDYDPFTYGRE